MSKKEIKALLDSILPDEQHNRVEVIQGKRGGYDLKNKARDTLQYYHRKGWITDSQNKAGERLWHDYRIAGIYCPRGMEIKESVSGSSAPSNGERQQEARQRVRKAWESISGEIGKSMVFNVCCYSMPLKGVTYDNYDNSKSRMARFREAMDDLVCYYA